MAELDVRTAGRALCDHCDVELEYETMVYVSGENRSHSFCSWSCLSSWIGASSVVDDKGGGGGG